MAAQNSDPLRQRVGCLKFLPCSRCEQFERKVSLGSAEARQPLKLPVMERRLPQVYLAAVAPNNVLRAYSKRIRVQAGVPRGKQCPGRQKIMALCISSVLAGRVCKSGQRSRIKVDLWAGRMMMRPSCRRRRKRSAAPGGNRVELAGSLIWNAFHHGSCRSLGKF